MSRICKGFTLVELMIVIAIISILIAILLPNFMRARANGLLSSCESNLRNLATALETYSTDTKGRFPSALSILVAEGYVSTPELPKCPSTKLDYSYTYTQVPDAYTMWCAGSEAHIVIDVPAGYPQYESDGGMIDGR